VHQERGVRVNINTMGLRGPEIEVPKPPDRRRFMTTGDSSIFGFGVQDDQVFSAVAARELGPEVEAVNAATPGYSTYETINLLHLRALAAEPDLLVVANLWSDNNFDSFVDKEVLARYAGFEQSLSSRALGLLSRSSIYRVMDWKMRLRGRSEQIQKVGWFIGKGEPLGLRRVEINDYAANLDNLARLARSRGAEVLFIIPPNNEDLVPASEGSNGKAWDPYRQVMRDTAARYGAPLISMPEVFAASGKDRGQLFLDEMHPTALGHDLMGRELARVLQEKGWARGATLMGEGKGGGMPTYEDPYVKGGASSKEGPQGSAVAGAAKVEGTVKADRYQKGQILLDAITPGEGQPTVLASAQVARPGPFSLNVGTADKVALRAYLDEDMDGPDADDELFDLTSTVVELKEGRASVLIDLDKSAISVQ
jgi:hypothetical protein